MVNDPRLECLRTLARNTRNLASDAAWDGDVARAERLWKQWEGYRDRIAAGESAEPRF